MDLEEGKYNLGSSLTNEIGYVVSHRSNKACDNKHWYNIMIAPKYADNDCINPDEGKYNYCVVLYLEELLLTLQIT